MSAQAPSTPSKRRGGVDETIHGINSRWKLGLPIRKHTESPSKSARPGSRHAKIYSKITFLHFKDLPALNRTLALFERHASSVYSDWVFKPLADVSLLRPSDAASRPVLQSILPPDKISSLVDALLRFLDDASAPLVADAVGTPTGRRSVQASVAGLSEVDSTNLSYDSEDMHPKTPSGKGRQPTISQFFGRRISQELKETTVQNEPPPFSEDFGSDVDIEMVDAVESNPETPAAKTGTEEVDKFTTPPEQPAISATLAKAGICFQSQKDTVTFRPMSAPPTKKRASNRDGDHQQVSRKVCRESEVQSTPRGYRVNQYDPVAIRPPIFSRSGTISASMSSASFTSDATSTSSFGALTPQTSFGSNFQGDGSCIITDRDYAINEEIVEKNKASLDTENTKMCDKEPSAEPQIAHKGSAVATNCRIAGKEASEYLDEHLKGMSPFSVKRSADHERFEYRVVYEVTRMASKSGIPPAELFRELQRHRHLKYDDPNEFYSTLSSFLGKSNKRLLERSTPAAWRKAKTDFDRVATTGDLSYSKCAGEPVLKFQLKPMRLDKSYRLERKYLGHRFLIVGLPGLEQKALPDYLKPGAEALKSKVIDWIVNGHHEFLGRTWKSFYIKRQDFSTKARKENRNALNAVQHQVYFFAVDGAGFQPSPPRALFPRNHKPVPVHQMLEWFMSAKTNSEQQALKLFARLQLAVSSTTKTLQFSPQSQILRCDDLYSCAEPGRRRLNVSRSEQKKNDPKGSAIKPERGSVVMNDGCSRISYRAAKYIADILKLDYVPSAFQGRIGGGKGMWKTDYTDEKTRRTTAADENIEAFLDPAVWIEITDSQLKFEGPFYENFNPDPHRVSFEVNDYSKPLTTTTLNFQLLPILSEQGVPKSVFERFVREDVTTKTSRLKAAMEDPLALRIWVQEQYSVASTRVQSGGVTWAGGFPDEPSEQINSLVEYGFDPKSCKLLKDLCYEEIKKYSNRLTERMQIGIGRSTYAYMLADPLGILEEGEVHFGFSTCFSDPKSGFADTMLEDMDLLVARSPALLASDVQKVRAAFKTALARYKDVILFSVKGKIPFAAKLSGGDYDGDRAWICWEPEIVNPFRNANVPEAAPLKFFGIQKDQEKVSDIFGGKKFNDHETSRFIQKGFEFTLKSSMLGIVTKYHEAYIYWLRKQGKEKCVNDFMAEKIATLLGYLVDSTKGGLIFGEKEWSKFKSEHRLPAYLPQPAFSSKNSTKHNPKHITDYLVFEVNKEVIEQELGDFSKRYKDGASTWDADLESIWTEEKEFANLHEKNHPDLKAVLEDLKLQVDQLKDDWHEMMPPEGEDKTKSFSMRCKEMRYRFLAIRPLQTDTYSSFRWGAGSATGSTLLTTRSWDLVKASALYSKHYKQGKFSWYTCGKELLEIKAMRVSENRPGRIGDPDRHEKRAEARETRTGGTRMIVRGMYEMYKVDPRMADRMEQKEQLNADNDDDEEETQADEFGDLGSQEWASVMSEMGYLE